MDPSIPELTEQTVLTLLNILEPGSELRSINAAEGSFSNSTHIVTAKLKDGSDTRIAIRRYKVFGDYDRGEKARREFKTFEFLKHLKVPAPEPLYLDETGEVLGIPGIVTRFVDGRLMMDTPADPLDWARKLARTLAGIHSLPCSAEVQKFLLKGNAEASWFLKYDAPPAYMQSYPGGSDLWELTRALYPKLLAEAPVLLHIDYWSGNILWHENEISAVIDWEEAAYGDPAVDVAYARMNMALMGLPDAADEFLRVYEAEAGHAIKNLGFWELAACVRPMIDPEGWTVAGQSGVTSSILLKFIEDAKRKV